MLLLRIHPGAWTTLRGRSQLPWWTHKHIILSAPATALESLSERPFQLCRSAGALFEGYVFEWRGRDPNYGPLAAEEAN